MRLSEPSLSWCTPCAPAQAAGGSQPLPPAQPPLLALACHQLSVPLPATRRNTCSKCQKKKGSITGPTSYHLTGAPVQETIGRSMLSITTHSPGCVDYLAITITALVLITERVGGKAYASQIPICLLGHTLKLTTAVPSYSSLQSFSC